MALRVRNLSGIFEERAPGYFTHSKRTQRENVLFGAYIMIVLSIASIFVSSNIYLSGLCLPRQSSEASIVVFAIG